MPNLQLAKTAYNKDENWAKFTADDGFRVVLDEAVAVDGGDTHITVYGWVSKANGLSVIGDNGFKPADLAVAIKIPKKDSEYTNKETNKTTKTPSYASGKAFIKLVEEVGYNVPFSGIFDGMAGEEECSIILTGKDAKGNEATNKELEFIHSKILGVTKLDELVKLKDIKIPEGNGKGGYRGSSSQPQSGKQADRLALLLELVSGNNESLESIGKYAYGEQWEASKPQIAANWFDKLID